MITNKGKQIIATYLADGTSAYASYIGVGCGNRPRTTFSVDVATTEAHTTTGNNAGAGYAYITTATAHDFQIGDQVKIYNVDGGNIDSVYLNTWTITAIPSSTSFKFAIPGSTTPPIAVENISSEKGKVILDFSNKTSMDYEMLRIPIKSKSQRNENGLRIVELSADLPTTERYEISEIGLFSDIADTIAPVNNRVIFSFSNDYIWQYHKSSTISEIPFITQALDAGNALNTISVTDEVFQANSNNSVFANTIRLYDQERPRYEKSTYFMLGNTSNLVKTGDGTTGNPYRLTPTSTTNHIEATVGGLSQLQKATNPAQGESDEIRLALSVVKKVNATADPDEVRVLVEFATQEGSGSETSSYRYARFHGAMTNSEQDFSKNRYVVLKQKMNQLEVSQNFSWDQVVFAKIYVSVIKSGSASSDYYVALDSLKFEYTTSQNPIYGLTGYTLIKNTNNLTVTKEENATQSITFKFAVGV